MASSTGSTCNRCRATKPRPWCRRRWAAPLEPDADGRLWELTRGNVLYVRNIVEQEVAEGRLAEQKARWRWVADPVVPSSLVGLIDSRIGELPSSVSDVVDALAVGEPIELGVAAANH